MTFRKGQSGNPAGKKPGTQNKVNATFKEAIRLAFDRLGGVEHLLAWAKKNPAGFYSIYARMMPPGMPVRIALSGTPTEQADQIVTAMGTGELAPSEADTIMGALTQRARIVETTEMIKRLDALEARLQEQTDAKH